MRLLIVDDELVSRMKLQKILESAYECKAVENGEDALQAARSDSPPELIFLDINMPGIDGYEVIKRLKADPATKEIPVIFLSAQTEVEDITRGLELGAVDYITKPFQKAEVKARASTHLSLKKTREELYKKNVLLEDQVKEIQEKTEQLRQKDLQLIEMDRIAGIGTLAAGIAHEINNPLGFVKSSVGFVKKGVDKITGTLRFWDDKAIPESLRKEYNAYLEEISFGHTINSLEKKFDTIKRGIERIVKIVSNLKSFSRVDKEEAGAININQSIEEAIEVLTSQEFESVDFVKDLREVPLCECSANDINQCFLHTIRNAVDAVGDNGIITINSAYDEEEKQIIIKIIDNGKGMSPEVLRQALNPFFTTKPVGSGTGVGLTIVERIIKRHGGKIELSSEENVGTTVIMTLPAENRVLKE